MEKNIIQLIDSKLVDINFERELLYTPENSFSFIFVKKDKKYEMTVSCFVRINEDDKILLTSSDEFFDLNHKILDAEDCSYLLVNKNIKNVLDKVENKRVVKCEKNKYGDITIAFENNVSIFIFVDCLYEGYTYYTLTDDKTNVITSLQYLNSKFVG